MCARKGRKAWQHENSSNVAGKLMSPAVANTELDSQSCIVMSSI